jgi:hypothetical protein
MRKLWIAGMVVASLTGIAYAQVERQNNRESWEQTFRDASNAPKTCRDNKGVVRKLGETTSAAQIEFQCVQVWGDGLSGISTGWLRVPQPAPR